MINLALLDRVLRAPGEVASACRDERDADAVARTALVTLVVSSVAFGAAIGTFHGGRQIAFAMLKMPLVVLVTLGLAAPAFYALTAVFGRPWRLRAVFSLVLAAGARFALVMLATTPICWLTIDFGTPYEAIKLTATTAYGLAGLAGLEVLVRGLGEGRGRRETLVLFVCVFLGIGAQTAWVMRPYLGRPGVRTMQLFTREREGGLVVQLHRAVHRLVGASR